MADGKFLIGKPAGGVTTVTMTDGASNTNLILPESGTVATEAQVSLKANTADLKEIGVGQTWQNVGGSRVLGATYTNSTGKPILVSLLFGNGGMTSGNYVYISVDGVPQCYNGMQLSQFSGIVAIVPNGSTYGAFGSTGTPGISFWKELR